VFGRLEAYANTDDGDAIVPMTMSCQDARQWPTANPRKQLILSLYGDREIAGPDRYLDNNQHDYDELSQEQFREVLGEVADAGESLGLFLDVESRVVDGAYIYSVNRLAEAVASRFAQLAERMARHSAIVNAIDSGEISVSEADYPIARLVGNVINVAAHPVGGAPVVMILW